MRSLSGVLAGLLTILAAGCGGSAVDEAANHRLAGQVTVNGRPVSEAALVATAADGQTGGGVTTPAGEYTMPDPPKGLLKFHFMPGARGIPVKYTKPDNGLSNEYTGGLKTYDIAIGP